MPILHNLTATTPDNTEYEIRPSHWNDAHSVALVGSEVVGAFSNAGNVSFAVETNGFITASANVTAAASPVNVTAGTTSGNLQTIAFSNSNGMSFGLNGSTITGSHNGITSQSNQAFSAQGGSSAFQTLVFANSQGVSFSNSNGSIVASVETNYQAPGAYLTTARASNDAIGLNTAGSNVTWTANSSGLSLDARGYAGTGTAVTGGAAITVNSGGMSFNGASLAGTTSGFTGANISATITHNTAGLAMSMSVAAPGGAASQTLYATGNTTVNSSGTMALSSLLFRGYGIVSLGTSNGSILVSSPDPTTLSPSWYAVGNTTGASSSTTLAPDTISIQGTGGVSVGYSNGSLIISGNTGGGGGGAGISAGTQSVATGTVVYSNSNNISFGMSGSSRVTASAALNLYALGNTTQNSSTVLGIEALSLNAIGALTAGYSNGSVQLSAPAVSSLVAGANITISTAGNTISIIGATVAASPLSISAGTTSSALQSIVFSNSNGVSFGLNGSTITGSHNGLTTQTVQTQASGDIARSGFTSAGNNIGLSGTLNSGGLSLSATVAAQSVQPVAASAANGSFTFATMSFSNLNGISFGTSAGSAITASHNGLTSQSNQAFSAPGGSSAFQTLTFANSQGVSWSNSNGSVVASVATNYAASDHSHGNPTLALTNLSGTTASNSAGLTISLSAAAPGGGGVTPAISAANGSYSFSTLSLSNANGISFGTSAGSAVTASYTVPTVTQYFSATNTTFNGANISGSMTLNTNGLQLSMSVAAPGAAAENNNIALLGANTAGNTTASGSTIGWSGNGVTLSGTNGSQIVISAPATSSLVATGIMSISTNGNTISMGVPAGTATMWQPFNEAVNVAGQQGNAIMHFVPLPTPTPAALGELQVDRLCIPLIISNSSNSTGTVTASYSFGLYTKNVSTLSLVMSTSYSAAATFSGTVNNSTFAGLRLHTVPWTTTIGDGRYYVAQWSRTTTGGGNCTVNQWLASQANSNYSGIFGANSNRSQQYPLGFGAYSVSFSTAMPSSVAISNIDGTNSLVARPPSFFMVNGTA